MGKVKLPINRHKSMRKPQSKARENNLIEDQHNPKDI